MFDPARLYWHLIEGTSFVLCGGLFIWAGIKNKLGKKRREGIVLGCGFVVYGLLALLGLV